jgi:hypothetical protein
MSEKNSTVSFLQGAKLIHLMESNYKNYLLKAIFCYP